MKLIDFDLDYDSRSTINVIVIAKNGCLKVGTAMW